MALSSSHPCGLRASLAHLHARRSAPGPPLVVFPGRGCVASCAGHLASLSAGGGPPFAGQRPSLHVLALQRQASFGAPLQRRRALERLLKSAATVPPGALAQKDSATSQERQASEGADARLQPETWELPSAALRLVLESLASPGSSSSEPKWEPCEREAARARRAFPLLLGTLLFAAAMQQGSLEPATAAEAHNTLADSLASPGSTFLLAFFPGEPSFEGPFWDNVLRFMVYFVTVFTGGLYTLLKPIYDLARNPFTLFLLVVVAGGGFLLMYVTLSAMLGLNEADVNIYT